MAVCQSVYVIAYVIAFHCIALFSTHIFFVYSFLKASYPRNACASTKRKKHTKTKKMHIALYIFALFVFQCYPIFHCVLNTLSNALPTLFSQLLLNISKYYVLRSIIMVFRVQMKQAHHDCAENCAHIAFFGITLLSIV